MQETQRSSDRGEKSGDSDNNRSGHGSGGSGDDDNEQLPAGGTPKPGNSDGHSEEEDAAAAAALPPVFALICTELAKHIQSSEEDQQQGQLPQDSDGPVGSALQGLGKSPGTPASDSQQGANT